MRHKTITLNEHGALGCSCGEDHGPSLREELDWALDRIKILEAELSVERAVREGAEHRLDLALRRLIHLRNQNDMHRDPGD